jgi:hypothetical protein
MHRRASEGPASAPRAIAALATSTRWPWIWILVTAAFLLVAIGGVSLEHRRAYPRSERRRDQRRAELNEPLRSKEPDASAGGPAE